MWDTRKMEMDNAIGKITNVRRFVSRAPYPIEISPFYGYRFGVGLGGKYFLLKNFTLRALA